MRVGIGGHVAPIGDGAESYVETVTRAVPAALAAAFVRGLIAIDCPEMHAALALMIVLCTRRTRS